MFPATKIRMTRDHYIAQTYLKHFGDPTIGGMLHACRESSGKTFRCWPRNVCREWDGDRNRRYLAHPELLGEFRALFEPNWNPAVADLLQGNITAQVKFVVAGYMANLMTCTPAWRRVCKKILLDQMRTDAVFAMDMHKKYGCLPDLPVDAIEAVERGEIFLDLDSDYIKAVVTRQLLQNTWINYNQEWSIIHNDTGTAYLTSDNPVAIFYSSRIGDPVTRLLPITPHLCLSILFSQDTPELNLKNPEDDLRKRPLGTISRREADDESVTFVNELVVKCAEDLVFSSTDSPSSRNLVQRFSGFRIDAEHKILSEGSDSVIHGSIVCVREMCVDA